MTHCRRFPNTVGGFESGSIVFLHVKYLVSEFARNLNRINISNFIPVDNMSEFVFNFEEEALKIHSRTNHH